MKVLQKQNTRDPRDSFKYLQKQDKETRRFFRITSKAELKEILDTSKIRHKGSPRSFKLLNYFKNKPTESLQASFKLLQKQNPQGDFKIL